MACQALRFEARTHARVIAVMGGVGQGGIDIVIEILEMAGEDVGAAALAMLGLWVRRAQTRMLLHAGWHTGLHDQ